MPGVKACSICGQSTLEQWKQAWKRASPVAEAYQKFADRWGSDDFSKYCGLLQQSADNALKEASQVRPPDNCQCHDSATTPSAAWPMKVPLSSDLKDSQGD